MADPEEQLLGVTTPLHKRGVHHSDADWEIVILGPGVRSRVPHIKRDLLSHHVSGVSVDKYHILVNNPGDDTNNKRVNEVSNQYIIDDNISCPNYIVSNPILQRMLLSTRIYHILREVTCTATSE